MRFRIAILIGSLLALAGISRAAEETPLLAHSPTVSKTQVVFAYGGYLWSVPRDGGDARQLTTGGHEGLPVFSPDGNWIAFTGQYDGNIDVFVMPAEGGEPRRLTWHPAADIAVGWTPDGKRVLFHSGRESYADFDRLYTVPVEGGPAEVLPMWRGEDAWFSPDALRIAYVPNEIWQTSWKRYRGGQTTPIYIVRLSDLALEKMPRENSNDSHPVWFGDTVYFLSDRNGAVTLFAYNTKTKAVRQVAENKGLDFKALSAGPDMLVYEQFGGIFLFDPASGKSKKVSIRIAGDLPATRPHYEKVGDKIQNAAISPTGARAVFEARGEIFTVPGEKGDIRNLTKTTAVAERDPAWSPDGKSIAYFSDESGEYALHIADQLGSKAVKKISLGNPPSYFYGPSWSPDGKKIAYTDKRLNLWYVDVEKGTPVKVTTDRYDDATSNFGQTWSPDSKWLTYAKLLENHQRAIFVYSSKPAKNRKSLMASATRVIRFSIREGNHCFLPSARTWVFPQAGWIYPASSIRFCEMFTPRCSRKAMLRRSSRRATKKKPPTKRKRQPAEKRQGRRQEQRRREGQRKRRRRTKEGREERRSRQGRDRPGWHWPANRFSANQGRQLREPGHRESRNVFSFPDRGRAAVRGTDSDHGLEV